MIDDVPVAQNDIATVTEGVSQDYNVCFVLDFSASIGSTDFATMLDAVTAAGQAYFNNASGDVSITVVRFAEDGNLIGTFDNYAAFEAALNISSNNRGVSSYGTDYTAGVQATMANYVPVPGAENQVFFISDGDPNEQTDNDTDHSLTDTVHAQWNAFLSNNDISVQTIGVTSGAIEARLQDVDEVDGDNAVVMVDQFDELVDTLVGIVNHSAASGNVLLGDDNAVGGGDDDSFGADGGHILSIAFDGVTHNATDGDLVNVATTLGGSFSFNFTTGAWSYTPPADVAADTDETFHYVLVDGDGDKTGADLTITVEDIDTTPPTVAVDIADANLNDGDNSSLVTFQFSEAVNGFDETDVTVSGGALSNFTKVDDDTYTATFTANDGLDGTGSVGVIDASYTDTSANAGSAGSDNVDIDTLNPTVTVNIVDTNLSDADNASLVTFEFSEDVSGFTAADVTTDHGTLSDFTQVDGNSYTAIFTADDEYDGSGSVGVQSNSYTDLAGNLGSGGSDNVAIDTVTPPNVAPVANYDHVFTNIVDGSPIHIPTAALLHNDTDADGDPLTVTNVGNASGGTVSGNVDFDPTLGAPVVSVHTYNFAGVSQATNNHYAYDFEVDPGNSNPNNINVLTGI